MPSCEYCVVSVGLTTQDVRIVFNVQNGLKGALLVPLVGKESIRDDQQLSEIRDILGNAVISLRAIRRS
jgi:hypothetical protein